MLTHFDEKGKIFTQVISKKPVQVIIQTDTHQIHGEVHIRPDERVKNALDNITENFIAVTNARIFSPGGEVVYETAFVAVHRSHITWVIPADDLNKVSDEDKEPADE